jgi:hypothetical protein
MVQDTISCPSQSIPQNPHDVQTIRLWDPTILVSLSLVLFLPNQPMLFLRFSPQLPVVPDISPFFNSDVPILELQLAKVKKL